MRGLFLCKKVGKTLEIRGKLCYSDMEKRIPAREFESADRTSLFKAWFVAFFFHGNFHEEKERRKCMM